jgi:8-oxo-dGTP pyrophosphatase MutT (NUDIX family)
MHIKIYFHSKPLFLCDEIDHEIQPYVHHDDAVFIDELNTHTVKTMLHEMEQPRVHAGVFFHKDLEELKAAFTKKFAVIKAAGGLVRNEKDEALMIFRRGRWDLPKGKLDNDEKLEACALREVEEETGLKNVKLNSPLITTYHHYLEGTKQFLKETYWFAMEVSGAQELKPQTEEDITDIQWADHDDIQAKLKEAYPLIADVISAAKQKKIIAGQ